MCTSVLLACISALCICLTPEARREFRSLGLELLMAVSCHMGAGRIFVLCKNSQCLKCCVISPTLGLKFLLQIQTISLSKCHLSPFILYS